MHFRSVIATAILLISGNIMAANKVIHFGTEAAYAPFEYVDATGAITGFDIDVAKAACKQMQAECTFSAGF